MDDLLKEAIADAKAVRETALANAKMALEEAFTPRIQSMLSDKIQSEIEGEEDQDEGNYDEGEHEGTVHFRALYRAGGGWGYLEENSRFVRDDERWYYVSGDTREGTLKPGRNESCPCGSGRKYKACCL